MHKQTLSLLALIISTATLHNNAHAALPGLPTATQLMRRAMRQRAAFTRPFISQATPPHVPAIHASFGRSSGNYMRPALLLGAGLALAGGCGNVVAHAEEKMSYKEFIRAARGGDLDTVEKCAPLHYACISDSPAKVWLLL